MKKILLLLFITMIGCKGITNHDEVPKETENPEKVKPIIESGVDVGDTIIASGFFTGERTHKGVIMSKYGGHLMYIKFLDGASNGWMDDFLITPYKSEWDALNNKKYK